jgi:hypothetical protein
MKSPFYHIDYFIAVGQELSYIISFDIITSWQETCYNYSHFKTDEAKRSMPEPKVYAFIVYNIFSRV